MNGYEVGSKIQFQGDEYVVINEPFEVHGGMMQRARRCFLNHPTICIPTPEQKAADIARNQKEYADQQAGFRRLKELQS